MAITELELSGYRGFAVTQRLSLAVPTGTPGSGLTILVGANNAGKSSVVEAIRDCAGSEAPSFTEGKRNEAADRRVRITLTNNDEGRKTTIETVEAGGSETQRIGAPLPESILSVPSRRQFGAYFGKSGQNREQYVQNLQNLKVRGSALDAFAYRLFEIQNNRSEFNAVLGQVLDPVPRWAIEQADSGQYYLKFQSNGGSHNSEGMGEGLVSLFVIIDALYDSKKGHVVVVDEPELSLHPSLQRRLTNLLAKYAADRQIVVSTHSPYFVDLHSLTAGARIARVHTGAKGSTISQLSVSTGKELTRLMSDNRNPHVLGLDAREVFFLDERVILVEGQDDVIHYANVTAQAGVGLPGDFFGWGVGGADKMPLIARVLSECGFERVVGLLDNDRAATAQLLTTQFPKYRFEVIPAKDVRTKDAVSARPPVEGLLDDKGVLRAELAAETKLLLERLRNHLAPADAA